MSSDDIVPSEEKFPIETFASKGYALRLLEFMYTRAERNYQESNLANRLNIAPDKLSDAIKVLKDYRFVKTDGEVPNRTISFGGIEKGTIDALLNMNNLQIYLAIKSANIQSLSDGYEDANKFI